MEELCELKHACNLLSCSTKSRRQYCSNVCRQSVCQALCSATLAMSALLQQLRPLTPELSSTACMDALLAVHAAMSSCPEALATLRGQPPSQAQLPCLQVCPNSPYLRGYFRVLSCHAFQGIL